MKSISREILEITYPVVYKGDTNKIEEAYTDLKAVAKNAWNMKGEIVKKAISNPKAQKALASLVTGEEELSGAVVDAIRGTKDFLSQIGNKQSNAFLNVMESWGLLDNFEYFDKTLEGLNRLFGNLVKSNPVIQKADSNSLDFRLASFFITIGAFQGNLIPSLGISDRTTLERYIVFEDMLFKSPLFSKIKQKDSVLGSIIPTVFSSSQGTASERLLPMVLLQNLLEQETGTSEKHELNQTAKQFNGKSIGDIVKSNRNGLVVSWQDTEGLSTEEYKIIVLDRDKIPKDISYGEIKIGDITRQSITDNSSVRGGFLFSDVLEYRIKRNDVSLKDNSSVVLCLIKSIKGEGKTGTYYYVVGEPFFYTSGDSENQDTSEKPAGVSDSFYESLLRASNGDATGIVKEQLLFSSVLSKVCFPEFSDKDNPASGLYYLNFPFISASKSALSYAFKQGATVTYSDKKMSEFVKQTSPKKQ